MKKEYRNWLKEFKKANGLNSQNEAIYKLIDMQKVRKKSK